jgi:hypothetical protein
MSIAKKGSSPAPRKTTIPYAFLGAGGFEGYGSCGSAGSSNMPYSTSGGLSATSTRHIVQAAVGSYTTGADRWIEFLKLNGSDLNDGESIVAKIEWTTNRFMSVGLYNYTSGAQTGGGCKFVGSVNRSAGCTMHIDTSDGLTPTIYTNNISGATTSISESGITVPAGGMGICFGYHDNSRYGKFTGSANPILLGESGPDCVDPDEDPMCSCAIIEQDGTVTYSCIDDSSSTGMGLQVLVFSP